MKRLKFPWWGIISGALLAMAATLRFTFTGNNYNAYTLCFIAALIIAHRFLPKTLWRILIILVCVGLVYFCIVEAFIIKHARTDKNAEQPYVIVLGAAVKGDVPSLSLLNRMKAARDYLNKYPEAVAIVSGGKGVGENISEAQCMFDWLTAEGIAPERIIMEDKATSTGENLEYSFEIIRSLGTEPDGNVAIVSSPYHLYRAKCMARTYGVEAAGVAGYFDWINVTVNYFIREAFGVTHMWVFGPN